MHGCDMRTNQEIRYSIFQVSFWRLKTISKPHCIHVSALLSSLITSIILLVFVDRAMGKWYNFSRMDCASSTGKELTANGRQAGAAGGRCAACGLL